MGIFKQKPEVQMDYKEYVEEYEKLPVYKTCNMALAGLFQDYDFDCCAIIDMKVFVKDYDTGRISEADLAHINTIESMVCQFADVVYAGKGIICAEGRAYLLFYLSEKSSQKVANVFSVMFQSAYNETETSMIHDPKGKKYFELLYPDKYIARTIETDNLIKQLNEYGDDCSKERDIKYYIIFTSKESVISFASEAFKNGFEYVDMIKESIEDRVLPQFKLILKTNMPFAKELVNEKVKYLIDLADKFSGVYKGVETDIVE